MKKKKLDNKGEKKSIDWDSIKDFVTITGKGGKHLTKGKNYIVTKETGKLLVEKRSSRLERIMSSIIQIADFKDTEYQLPEQKYGTYQNYLDKYEKYFLVHLLGADLYALFIADLVAGVPQTARFLDIYNPFEIDDGGCVRYSEGMKSAVMQYVYFYAVRDLSVKKTNTGRSV